MFTVPRQFSFKLTENAQILIHTIPVNEELHVFVGIHRKQLDNRNRVTATVFKVNKKLEHTGVIETPYTRVDEEKPLELTLSEYRLFKENVTRVLRNCVANLKDQEKKDRVNKLMQIVAMGMRHPDEVDIRRGLLKIVK